MNFIVVIITIMIHRSLAESSDHFWWPAEFENVANQYFENLKHLQNQVYLLLTGPRVVHKHFQKGGFCFQ